MDMNGGEERDQGRRPSREEVGTRSVNGISSGIEINFYFAIYIKNRHICWWTVIDFDFTPFLGSQ